MSQALPNSGVAAVTWSSSPQVRVYFQDLDFTIRESRFDGKVWSGGTKDDVINAIPDAKPAKPNTPIAAFEHREDVHVYYIATDDTIQEITGSGSAKDWAVPPHSLSRGTFKAHPLSRLAALPYTPGSVGIDCSVFYQNTNGAIGHLRRVDEKEDGKFVSWKDMAPFGNNAIYGTGLAAVYPDPYDGSPKARVYYQQSHNILADFGVEDAGAVTAGVLNQSDPPIATATTTNLAAASNKLFYLGSTNWFTSGSYYTSRGKWVIGADHPGHIRVHPNSGVAVVLDRNSLYRAYVQDDTNEILELSFSEPWSDGAKKAVPTGADVIPNPVVPHASIAATSSHFNQSFVQVFSQDSDSRLRQSTDKGQGWFSGTLSDDLPKAKQYTPIAATNYGSETTYVYYLTPDNEIREACHQNEPGQTWYEGPLNKLNIKASPASRLAVCSGHTEFSLFLYYQKPDGALGELRRVDVNGAWTPGRQITGKALVGTGLAALTFKTTYKGQDPGNHLFYQQPSGEVVDFGDGDYPDGFIQGQLDITGAAAATNLAAVWLGYWYTEPTITEFKVFFFNQSSAPSKWGYYSERWHDEQVVDDKASFPNSGIAVIPDKDDYQNTYRLYIKDKDNQIQEYYWTKGNTDWRKGSILPSTDVQ